MSELLLKFNIKGDYGFKAVIPAGVELEDPSIVRAVWYRSRSGLHWRKCYLWNGEDFEKYVGLFKVRATLLSYHPITYSETFKPIASEGKYIVQVPNAEELYLNIAKAAIEPLYEQGNIIACTDVDGVDVYVAEFEDYEILGYLYDNQANLHIATVWVPRKLEETLRKAVLDGKWGKYDNKVLVSKHLVLLNDEREGADIIKFERRTSNISIEGYIILGAKKLSIHHPEHGHKEINFGRYVDVIVYHKVYRGGRE